MAFFLPLGVVYQVKKSYKRIEYRLFIFLKISKREFFARKRGALFCLMLTIARSKEVGVALYYTMKKSYVSIPKQYHNNTIV